MTLDPQDWAFAIAVAVGVFGTPLAWRMTRGAARLPRIAAVSLACIGFAALFSVGPTFLRAGLTETPLLATLCSLIVQAFVLPFLLFLPRKA
ncbi:hypothetical protein ACE7GA_15825 [Roseomonas sp. CCTCC AB2023176]|uniref:hypothetical protein n=1 Tax=Roseomonas sp. CCTCC AB2023176 TaxID=3342640 RepID=UPI0035DEEDCA